MPSIHPIWINTKHNTKDVKRGCIKARMLAGVYPTQTRLHKIQKANQKTCTLCYNEDEDLVHMLFHCSALFDPRQQSLIPIKQLLTEYCEETTVKYLLNEKDHLLKLLIDVNHLASFVSSRITSAVLTNAMAQLECISRIFIYSMHCRRTHLLELLN